MLDIDEFLEADVVEMDVVVEVEVLILVLVVVLMVVLVVIVLLIGVVGIVSSSTISEFKTIGSFRRTVICSKGCAWCNWCCPGRSFFSTTFLLHFWRN